MKINLPSSIDKSALLPDNMMLLTDGTQIPLHLRKENPAEEVGQESAARKQKNRLPSQLLGREDNFPFFIDNVFFFIAHYETILSDSRMFLAPVTSWDTMIFSTLGVFIEWWINNPEMIGINQDGELHIAVSCYCTRPFFGLSSVDENGHTHLLFGEDKHFPFYTIDERYDQCKSVGEAYTLAQVKELLNHQEDQSADYIDRAYRYALTWKSYGLTNALGQMQRELRNTVRDKLFYANAQRMAPIIDGYQKLEAKNAERLEVTRSAIRYLKSKLKAGTISNKDYQKQLSMLKKKKDSLRSDTKYDVETMLSLIFPDKGYTVDDLLEWNQERKSLQA